MTAERRLHAAKVKKVVEVLQHKDNTCILVLHVDDGQEVGLIFDGDTAETAVSQLLGGMPPSSNTQLAIEVDNDLVSPRNIDHVEVRQPSQAGEPFDLEFVADGKSWVKLTMSTAEAVRWLYRLKAQIADHIKRQGN